MSEPTHGSTARTAAPRQKDLVFDWNDRDVILREAKLPPLVTADGIAVKQSTAMLVLRNINSHAGNKAAWPSIDTLADECQEVSARTVRRVIKALELAGLLCVERRRVRKGDSRSVNHYWIVWSELALFCRRPIGHGGTDQSATAARTNRPRETDQSATWVAAKASQEAPIQAQARRSDGDWQKVIAKYRPRLRIICQLAQQARARGQMAAEFAKAIQDAFATAALPQNAERLTKPDGAVGWFLLHGDWPVPDIVSLEKAARQRAQADAARREEEEHRRAVAEGRAETAKLEAIYGATLDGMGRDELVELAGAGTMLAKGCLTRPGFGRPTLLQKLHERTESQHAVK